MAELVAELGEGQGDAEGQGTAQAEQVREGGEEAFPVAYHQEQAEAEYQRQAPAQQPVTVTLQHRPGAVEEAVGAPQGDTEEQVLVQHPLAQALVLGSGLGRVAGALLGIQGGDQVMATEKAQQLLQLGRAQGQARLGVRGIQHALRVTQGPMAEQAHGGGAELEVTPAQGVGQGPLRRAVQAGGGWRQLQVGAQRRQHQKPRLWRSAARGRRSR
ncbi:hypothetical protein D3C85_651730 [compost metagenome]